MPDAVQMVKKAAVEAVEAGKPVHLLYGTVISIAPLKIQSDQKSIYTERMLILTRNVTEYHLEMSVAPQTAQESRGVFIVHSGLKVGEKVLLARMQRGKKFVVLDRIGGGST